MSKQDKHHEDTSVREASNKRTEIEAVIQSRRASQEADETAISKIIEYIEEKIYPFSFNRNGVQTIEKLYHKFELADIFEAIDTSATKYLKYNGDDELQRMCITKSIRT